MGRRDRLRSFWRDFGNTANSPQPQKDEARANLGIRPFPPREDLPPPEISGTDVRHVELVYITCLMVYLLHTHTCADMISSYN